MVPLHGRNVCVYVCVCLCACWGLSMWIIKGIESWRNLGLENNEVDGRMDGWLLWFENEWRVKTPFFLSLFVLKCSGVFIWKVLGTVPYISKPINHYYYSIILQLFACCGSVLEWGFFFSRTVSSLNNYFVFTTDSSKLHVFRQMCAKK